VFKWTILLETSLYPAILPGISRACAGFPGAQLPFAYLSRAGFSILLFSCGSGRDSSTSAATYSVREKYNHIG
jgi:hypothetical protein